MSDYQTWTRRDVLHADGWGWRVTADDPGISVVQITDGQEPADDEPRWDMDPAGARALAAALIATAEDLEQMEAER